MWARLSPTGEGRGEGERDARTTQALRIGFDARDPVRHDEFPFPPITSAQGGSSDIPDYMKHYTPPIAMLLALALATGARAQQPFPAGPINPLPPPRDSTGLTPLTELGTARYKGEDGGLYGGGKNEPPAAHAAAARKQSAKIVPRDPDGKPAKDGKIGVLSVGMSNTTMEYSVFKRLAEGDLGPNQRQARTQLRSRARGSEVAAGAVGPVSLGRWREAA